MGPLNTWKVKMIFVYNLPGSFCLGLVPLTTHTRVVFLYLSAL